MDWGQKGGSKKPIVTCALERKQIIRMSTLKAIHGIAYNASHCRNGTLNAKALVVEIRTRCIDALSWKDAREVHVHDLENRAECHDVPGKGETEELWQCGGDLELGDAD